MTKSEDNFIRNNDDSADWKTTGESVPLRLEVGDPKRAETANEHAQELLQITKLTSEDMERYSLRIERACFAAAAEIERLAADRDSWKRQAEIQAVSLNQSNAEVERLAARVRELEGKSIPRLDLDLSNRRA